VRLITYVRWLMLAVVMMLCAAPSFAQIGVSITIAPPELPVYEQPVCPGDDYIWTPGYWAWGDDDYYWVPGTWVEAPEAGFFWTPGYWGWENSSYIFYPGYWGPQVGFYGGIDYGFGYFGHGYEGGRWDNGHFFYNRSVSNVNVAIIHNVYNTTVVHNDVNRVSFNGPRGISDRPTAQEEAASHDRHVPAVAAQTQHMDAARSNPQLRASVNHGKPAIAATPKPGAFTDRGVAPAREGGAVSGPATGSANNTSRTNTMVHARDIPAMDRPAAPNTGNPKVDQKYQQQQAKLSAKQDQEQQKLQQKQDQDHQRLAQQHANDARTQQVEQQHQQQTQQLQQRHVQQQQQMQQMQQRQPPARQSQPKAEEKH
jgi:WXXGXW repeat (2 copies)